MKKQEYEALKAIRIKVQEGTATFAERNYLKVREKQIANAKKRKQ